MFRRCDEHDHDHKLLHEILEKVTEMPIAQAQFDADLVLLLTAQNDFVVAALAKIGTLPAPADMTTEDQQVATAAQALADALATISPAAVQPAGGGGTGSSPVQATVQALKRATTHAS